MSKNVKIDFSGLEKLQKNVDELSKTKSIKINELFTSKFISQNTNFSTSDDFFNACNIHSDEDLKNISDNEMDKLVSQHTKFNSWQDMLNASTEEYIKNKLGF